MKNFSFSTRSENLQKLESLHFDILIIGGGITGAGVARDAAMRGLKVALVEAQDFAEGTSSRSSKLVHGGIRYLENLEFKLVFEALSERAKLFEIAPNMVHPLRFMIPLYKNSRVGMFKMGLGMFLYDCLALFKTPEMHERLNASETADRMPILAEEQLCGSYVYSDAYMDDDRLVHETLRSANEHEAIITNYVKAIKSEIVNGKVSAIEVRDELTGKYFKISCDQVVCTVGPWTDLVGETMVHDWQKILRPTKGIHLTFSKARLNLSSAVVMAAQESNRIVFAIPRHEMIIVGTTDTDYSGNPNDVKTDAEDVRYLLEITNRYFPKAELTEKDIISSYVGVRPLVKDEAGSEGKTSREHMIKYDERGFHFVAGGKYTTYRLMSEQIVDGVLKQMPAAQKNKLRSCETNRPLNEWISKESFFVAENQTESDLQKKLVERYGLEAFEIIKRYSSYKDYWSLESCQAIHQTMCLNLTDFYTRRVPLMLAEKDHGLSILETISKVFKQELNLTEAQIEKQKQNLINHIKTELSWRTQSPT
jgi:glycerol-3-phosphate dehydrogenase